ncbi:MAG: transcriptional repressor LexA [Actinobacteria bacterium]|nr:transcriptional repressor LexA [Actinomycetota bacterium]
MFVINSLLCYYKYMSKNKNELSARHKEILNFIIEKIKESGYPPTVREIAKAVNLKSSATIHAHLSKLQELGFIKKDPSKPRTIVLNSELMKSKFDQLPISNNTIFVPVVGQIAAGTPILADENVEDYFPLTPDFAKGNNEVFMLHVKGDSMVNAGILDKDYLIVRKQNTAMNGEIVAVMLEDEATVKRFFKKANSIKLMPENDFMEPIEVKEAKILGKVIGIVRKYF